MSYGQSTLGEFRGIGQALPGDTRPLPGGQVDTFGYAIDSRPALTTHASAASATALILTRANARTVVFVGAGVGAITVTLPPIATTPAGLIIEFANCSGGVATINTATSTTLAVQTGCRICAAVSSAGVKSWVRIDTSAVAGASVLL